MPLLFCLLLPSACRRMVPDLSELRQRAGAVEANLAGRFAGAAGAEGAGVEGAGGALGGEGGDQGEDNGQEADSAEQEARRERRKVLAEIKVRLLCPLGLLGLAVPAEQRLQRTPSLPRVPCLESHPGRC
jgi:hypothetical protein